MKLNIDLKDIENKTVHNLAKRLEDRFRPNSDNDISDAVTLASYLYILGKPSEAIGLLESFIYFNYEDKPEKYRHLWVSNCEGLLLLVYIQKNQGIVPIEHDLVYVMGPDSEVNPVKFMHNDLKYSLKSNVQYLDHALTETDKYKCQTYAQQVLKFISLVVLWPYYSNKTIFMGFKPVKINMVTSVLDQNIDLLKSALTKPANKSKQKDAQ